MLPKAFPGEADLNLILNLVKSSTNCSFMANALKAGKEGSTKFNLTLAEAGAGQEPN